MIIFDGTAKTMTVASGVTNISVRDDLYGGWKRWIRQGDNAKYARAMRVVGGDPVGAGQFAGDLYFLMNGWRVVVPHRVYANGALFHDDAGIDPFDVLPGGGITSVVSALVQTVNVAGSAGGSGDAPSLSQIVSALNPRFDGVHSHIDTVSGQVAGVSQQVSHLTNDVLADTRQLTQQVNQVLSSMGDLMDEIEDTDTTFAVSQIQETVMMLGEMLEAVSSQVQQVVERPDLEIPPVDLAPVIKGLKDVMALVVAMS